MYDPYNDIRCYVCKDKAMFIKTYYNLEIGGIPEYTITLCNIHRDINREYILDRVHIA